MSGFGRSFYLLQRVIPVVHHDRQSSSARTSKARGFAIGLMLAVLVIPSTGKASQVALSGSVGGDMPLVASGSLDLMLSTTGDVDEANWFPSGALLLGAAAGAGGGELRAGYAFISTGSGGLALGGTATVLRTWGDPWNAEPDETYAGLGLFFQDIVKVGVGALFRVDGSEARVMPRITVGLGYLSAL